MLEDANIFDEFSAYRFGWKFLKIRYASGLKLFIFLEIVLAYTWNVSVKCPSEALLNEKLLSIDRNLRYI